MIAFSFRSRPGTTLRSTERSSLVTRTVLFQLSVGVKASLAESQQMSYFPFISIRLPFILRSFPLMFLACCIHVFSFRIDFLLLAFMLHSFPFMFLLFCIHSLSFCMCSLSFSFHVLMSFHFLSLCIKHTGFRNEIYSNQPGGYIRPNTRVFFICHYRLVIVLEACAGGIFRVHEHVQCTGISSLSYFFL
jgi:hypothetical protein